MAKSCACVDMPQGLWHITDRDLSHFCARPGDNDITKVKVIVIDLAERTARIGKGIGKTLPASRTTLGSMD